MWDFQELLQELVQRRGSDLFLIAGTGPRIRVDGQLVLLDGPPVEETLVTRVMKESGVEPGSRNYPLSLQEFPADQVLEVAQLSRFRCHFYRQAGMWAMAIRPIPLVPPSVQELGVPSLLGDLTRKKRGLILVSGPAGSGRTTTVSSLLDKINGERRVHVLTLESPVEFRHPQKKSIFSQRTLGVDLTTFLDGVATISRESPDVVMFGDLKDSTALESALSLVESGHLVLGVTEGASSLQALQRLLHLYSPPRDTSIRLRIAAALEGMVSQVLVPRAKGHGRVLAVEVIIPTSTVRHLLREDKIQQVYSIMQTGQAKHGMQTLNQALVDLYRRRVISASAAMAHSYAAEELQHLVQRAEVRMRTHVARPAG